MDESLISNLQSLISNLYQSNTVAEEDFAGDKAEEDETLNEAGDAGGLDFAAGEDEAEQSEKCHQDAADPGSGVAHLQAPAQPVVDHRRRRLTMLRSRAVPGT